MHNVAEARCPSQDREYEDGEEVPLTCPTGYVLRGPSTSTCRNGAWVPEEPTCLKICIRPIFLNFDLNISPSQRSYIEGDVIRYSCDEGHVLYGTTTATCTKEGFDPPEVPQCEDLLQCHTEKQTICEPSGADCNNYAPSSENEQRILKYCSDNTKLCFIYRFGVQGNSVTVNTTTSGCVANGELSIQYGCYGRDYLEIVDSSGADKLSKLEKELGTTTDDVQVCFCDRDACNESVETAARNHATITPVKMKMILGSLMGYLSVWT